MINVKIDGQEIWMENDESVKTNPNPQPVSASALAEQSLAVAEQITHTIRAYSSKLIGAFEDFQTQRQPKKVTAEFGLALSGEGNVYVVKTSANASLKVSVEWELDGNTTS